MHTTTTKQIGLAALLAALTIGCGNVDDEGESALTCDPEGHLWMSSCDSSDECGPVMSCFASCPSCSKSCKIGCSSDADCEAYGAGYCKSASCSTCRQVCSGAPTTCWEEPEEEEPEIVFQTCPTWIDGCSPYNECTECDSSCGDYCQNLNSSYCGPEDCMTCSSGYTLEVLWSDGTGRCVSEDDSCACNLDDIVCIDNYNLATCDDGCNWQSSDCDEVCRDAGYDYSSSCGYSENRGHDVCWCDYF